MPLCAGNAQYIKYLTPMRALWFFLNAPFRARRFFDSDGALEMLVKLSAPSDPQR